MLIYNYIVLVIAMGRHSAAYKAYMRAKAEGAATNAGKKKQHVRMRLYSFGYANRDIYLTCKSETNRFCCCIFSTTQALALIDKNAKTMVKIMQLTELMQSEAGKNLDKGEWTQIFIHAIIV